MNKFEKLAKLEIAYQLVAQVHSDLCNERERNDKVSEKALDLTREILMFKCLVQKEISDDMEIRIARATAHRLGENVRNALSKASDERREPFSFDEVERMICAAVDEIWED